jgi:type I restriction enzyme M protein
MVYWAETMQDDVYTLVDDGWEAGRQIDRKERKREWEGRIIPKDLIIASYFAAEQKAIESIEAVRDDIARQMEEMEEEHGGEEGLMADAQNDAGNITKASVQKRLKEIQKDKEASDERKVLQDYLKLAEQEAETDRKIKDAQTALEKMVSAKYQALTETEIKTLVVENKWMATIERDVRTEMERISQRLTGRIKELAERYEAPLPELTTEVETLEQRVHAHVKKMGFVL